MAKKIKTKVRMQLKGGGATPAPPVGSSLGQHGVNLMDFCKKFNAATSDRKGQTVPVIITIYVDKSFDFVTKTPPVAELLLKKAGLKKGSGKVGSEIIGTIDRKIIEEIATIKMPDLNAFDMQAACRIVVGSARSIGIKVED